MNREQRRVLDAIRAHFSQYEHSPTLREIGDACGLSSASTVKSHVDSLRRLGLVTYIATCPRTIRLARSEPA
jgi:repressor LexA